MSENQKSTMRLYSVAVALCLLPGFALADWHRVPGGLRLSGAIHEDGHTGFLVAFWAAALEEPRHVPIGLWLASDGGDEAAAFRLARVLAEAQETGLRIATVVPRGHACSGACNILFSVGDERFRTVSGSDLLVISD